MMLHSIKVASISLVATGVALVLAVAAQGGDTSYSSESSAVANPPESIDPPSGQSVLAWQAPSASLHREGIPSNVIPGDGGGSSIDRFAIVDYAKRYVGTLNTSSSTGYNSDYLHFKNDCQNLVSQAIHAGHWKDITPPAPIGPSTGDDHYWYYGYFSPLTYTYSWTVASHFEHHINITTRRTYLRYWYRANIGDVVLVDWDGSAGGVHVAHSMIVTKIDANDVYLTYHTTNRLNKSVKSLQAANPQAVWWLISADS